MGLGVCAGRVCISNVLSMTLTLYMCVLVRVLVFGVLTFDYTHFGHLGEYLLVDVVVGRYTPWVESA
jgi:hypothetical protein